MNESREEFLEHMVEGYRSLASELFKLIETQERIIALYTTQNVHIDDYVNHISLDDVLCKDEKEGSDD